MLPLVNLNKVHVKYRQNKLGFSLIDSQDEVVSQCFEKVKQLQSSENGDNMLGTVD